VTATVDRDCDITRVHACSTFSAQLMDELSNHEIHNLSSRFNLQVRDEAAYLLCYIWRTNRAACISALEHDELYVALNEANASGDYEVIRRWRGMYASRSC
jgi:hypothetical protein